MQSPANLKGKVHSLDRDASKQRATDVPLASSDICGGGRQCGKPKECLHRRLQQDRFVITLVKILMQESSSSDHILVTRSENQDFKQFWGQECSQYIKNGILFHPEYQMSIQQRWSGILNLLYWFMLGSPNANVLCFGNG